MTSVLAATSSESVAALLARHRSLHPSRPAIVDVDDGRSIDFAQLQSVVDGVAEQLHDGGVQAGDRVVLATGAPIETVIMWLALWRLSAVVCPLDESQLASPAMPRIRSSMNPSLVLVGRGCEVSCLDVFGATPLMSFGGWPAGAAQPGRSGSASEPRQAPETHKGSRSHVGHSAVGHSAVGHVEMIAATGGLPPDVGSPSPADPASMCCTSGSSGSPKIVVHDHLSYWLNGLDSVHLLELTPSDRLLEYRSLSWSSSQILSLMPFLQLGLTLCVARHFSRRHFPQWIVQHGVTVAAGVPTVIAMLLNGPLHELRESARGLRLMTCSSAPLSRETWERFERLTGIPLITLYGSSEAGWITGSRLQERRIGTVGVRVPHAEFEIVDGEQRPCAIGEAGQVMVSGPKLALGLLNAGGSIVPLSRPFVTNDVGERDADGFVRLLGRTDDLIIRGGVKIAPADIEDWLLRYPGVAEAAVIGVADRIYGSEAVAFVVLRAAAGVVVSALELHAASGLPADRRPRRIFIVDALPRNERGKLRRDVLRERWWSDQVRGL